MSDFRESDEYRLTRTEAGEAAIAAQEGVEVTDEETLSRAVEIAAKCAEVRRAAEARRKDLKAPVLERGRQIDAAFKELLSPVSAAENALKAQIGAYQAEQRRKAEEERRRQEELARRRQAAEDKRAAEQERVPVQHRPAVVPEPERTARSESGAKASVRMIRRHEVVSAWELPAEYLMPDEKKIAAAVREGKDIPGVRVWEEPSVAVGR